MQDGGRIGEYGWKGANSRVTYRDGRKARDRVLLARHLTTHIPHRGSIKQTAAHDGHSACGLYSMFERTDICNNPRQMRIDLLVDFKAGPSVF